MKATLVNKVVKNQMVLDHYYALEKKTRELKNLKEKQDYEKAEIVDRYKDRTFKLLDHFQLFMGNNKEREQAIR